MKKLAGRGKLGRGCDDALIWGMPVFSASDYAYMAQALRLAHKGLYSTSPNPRVGCILVRDGRVVGEGWHERAGAPHAEINALAAAGDAARGATAT